MKSIADLLTMRIGWMIALKQTVFDACVQVQVLDAGHFALDTAPDQIASNIEGVLGRGRKGAIK